MWTDGPELRSGLEPEILRTKFTSRVSLVEGRRLAHLAAHVPNGGTIVEIGSCWGASASYMAAGLAHVHKRAVIYCVDLWELGAGRTPDRHHTPGVLGRFAGNLRGLGLWDYIIPIRSESLAAAQVWAEPINLLFIDGGHKYDEVAADIAAWSGFLLAGHVIAFHDYNHDDVKRAVDEAMLPDLWEPISLNERLAVFQRRLA